MRRSDPMLAKLFIQYVLAAVFQVGVDDGYATRFGDEGDIHAGGDMACTQTPVPQDEPVCAHRWLPCGTEVVVLNQERRGATTSEGAQRGEGIREVDGADHRRPIDVSAGAARSLTLQGAAPAIAGATSTACSCAPIRSCC